MKKVSIVMLGATGAVGTQCVKHLISHVEINKLTLLGRRPLEGVGQDYIHQEKINIFEPDSYWNMLAGHEVAICTLGVGEPSKTTKENFEKIDKIAVLDFAKACKESGVNHFELLSSVGVSAKSRSYFLRVKGELVEELVALNFDRLSIFQPSMIITPQNRYGFSQAIILKVWPVIDKLFVGGIKKYKGVKVADLGSAIALNLMSKKTGVEYLDWSDFSKINKMNK